MATKRIEILTHRDLNHFYAGEGNYNGLTNLLGECGFQPRYLDGRAFILFNAPKEGYQTSVWTPRAKIVGPIVPKEDHVASREVALADFAIFAGMYFALNQNTILTYPRAYDRVRELCELAAEEVVEGKFSIDRVTPKP